MHRYATAPRSTFEELVEEVRRGGVTLDGAVYPPVCDGRGGPVTLTLGPTGAIIVHVEPGTCRTDDFRLRLLFQTGTCIFSTPDELWRFWTGPLAEAFGIEPAPAAGNEAHRHGRGRDVQRGEHRRRRSRRPRSIRPRRLAGTRHRGGGSDRRERSAHGRQRRLTTAALTAELAKVVHGQDAALERVASVTVAQLTKRHPARPGLGAARRPDGRRQDEHRRGAPGRARGARRRGRRPSSGSTARS